MFACSRHVPGMCSQTRLFKTSEPRFVLLHCKFWRLQLVKSVPDYSCYSSLDSVSVFGVNDGMFSTIISTVIDLISLNQIKIKVAPHTSVSLESNISIPSTVRKRSCLHPPARKRRATSGRMRICLAKWCVWTGSPPGTRRRARGTLLW